MDGNGRFAVARKQPRLYGHQQGIETLKNIVRVCPELGVDTLTLFAFAQANWKRDAQEVNGLWELFSHFVKEDAQKLVAEGVRIRIIGDREGLPKHVQQSVEQIEHDSTSNKKFLLQVGLNYDGLDEVVRLVQKAIKEGFTPETVTREYIDEHLDTEPGNPPDILIRTGMPALLDGMGVWRSSSFLPLQSVESVCVSVETLWPEFTPTHLQKVIAYADVESRLFGGQRG